MKPQKIVWILILVAIIALLGGLIKQKENTDLGDTGAVDTRDVGGSSSYEWEFKDLGSKDYEGPQTEVVLKSGTKEYSLGKFSGDCAVQNIDLLPNQESRVICWWAGAGSEIGIFIENGKRIVKVGDVDEGDSETPGFRGNFKVLMELGK
jgi:hypothetical protein